MAPPPPSWGLHSQTSGYVCVGATAPEGVFLAKHLADTHRGHVQGSIDISVQCLAAQFTCAQPMNLETLDTRSHPFRSDLVGVGAERLRIPMLLGDGVRDVLTTL